MGAGTLLKRRCLFDRRVAPVALSTQKQPRIRNTQSLLCNRPFLDMYTANAAASWLAQHCSAVAMGRAQLASHSRRSSCNSKHLATLQRLRAACTAVAAYHSAALALDVQVCRCVPFIHRTMKLEELVSAREIRGIVKEKFNQFRDVTDPRVRHSRACAVWGCHPLGEVGGAGWGVLKWRLWEQQQQVLLMGPLQGVSLCGTEQRHQQDVQRASQSYLWGGTRRHVRSQQ
jgi:hypothetical protein